MVNHKFKISFQIKHPEENLEFAAKKLGINPFRIWKANSQRKTPKGKRLDGKYDHSYCCLRLENEKGLCGTDLIAGILEEFEKDDQYWSGLFLSGGRFSLVIFGEKDKYISYADIFDWQLLDRLSKLKISLGFDI